MKKPKHIIVDIKETTPPTIKITFFYDKTFREIAFLADSVEDLPDCFGKRYKFINK